MIYTHINSANKQYLANPFDNLVQEENGRLRDNDNNILVKGSISPEYYWGY